MKPRRHTFTKSVPGKDHRGVDLISDALPFGGLWYGDGIATGGDLRLSARVLASCNARIAARVRLVRMVLHYQTLTS